MSGLWKNDPQTAEGKYPIVLRRDGSVLEGPYFVIVLRDPCASEAFAAYADAAEEAGLDPVFVEDVRVMAGQAEIAASRDAGDPDAPRHRIDDPKVLAWARQVHALGGGSV